jgi:hypothetical protein|tara:strand:- start:479 stop:670 length:192 start_codon:yes stop_codon:yes gene_type:complete
MTKRLNDINTFATSVDNETYIVGTDENGEDFTVVFNTIDLLEWIDKDTIKYMKRQTKKYITNL